MTRLTRNLVGIAMLTIAAAFLVVGISAAHAATPPPPVYAYAPLVPQGGQWAHARAEITSPNTFADSQVCLQIDQGNRWVTDPYTCSVVRHAMSWGMPQYAYAYYSNTPQFVRSWGWVSVGNRTSTSSAVWVG
jgi:hypothetical protein